jgi:hypothetical protein
MQKITTLPTLTLELCQEAAITAAIILADDSPLQLGVSLVAPELFQLGGLDNDNGFGAVILEGFVERFVQGGVVGRDGRVGQDFLERRAAAGAVLLKELDYFGVDLLLEVANLDQRNKFLEFRVCHHLFWKILAGRYLLNGFFRILL